MPESRTPYVFAATDLMGFTSIAPSGYRIGAMEVHNSRRRLLLVHLQLRNAIVG
jgi:hypothetical protein